MAEWALHHTPGTLQSSKISSQVLEPLMPSLSSFCAVEKPGIPYKTTYMLNESHLFQMILFLSQTKARQIPKTDQNMWSNRVSWRSSCAEYQIYLFNNKSGDSSLIGFGICLCINNQDVSIWSVCDPELVPVQHIVVTYRRGKCKDKVFCQMPTGLFLGRTAWVRYQKWTLFPTLFQYNWSHSSPPAYSTNQSTSQLIWILIIMASIPALKHLPQNVIHRFTAVCRPLWTFKIRLLISLSYFQTAHHNTFFFLETPVSHVNQLQNQHMPLIFH